MDITPLHMDFGVQIHGVDLRDATATHLYPEIRELFEEHSLLLFQNQELDVTEQNRLSRLFGPLEDRSVVTMDNEPPEISPVSNRDESGDLMDKDHQRLLDLKSNMLWHTDSTFLPIPALVNVLQAKVLPTEGGETEFVSTRAGFARMDKAAQQKLRQQVFHHRYGHSREKIDASLAQQERFTMWPTQRWRAVWKNPVNGRESVYIASHACAVDHIDDDAAAAEYLEGLLDSLTRPVDVYSHPWTVDDVIIWDERAILHRGTPWPYDQERTLHSLCVSARTVDGLASVTPDPAPTA